MSDDMLSAHELALPWHSELWQQVVGAYQSQRMAHGLLVCGPPGVGKRRFAERLARMLLCHAPGDDGQACERCAGCRQWQAGSHPDVSRLQPEQDGGLIRVEPMRAFVNRLHLTPQYDNGRLGWIDPAQQLNTAAANSLLKTLEEPPAGTHLLLISDHVDRLLPTIRSRCRLLRVPPAPVALARDWLHTQGVSAQSLDDNILRTPLAVLAVDQKATGELEQQWAKDLSKLLSGRQDAVVLAEKWAELPAEQLSNWLYRTACALLEYRLTGTGLHDDALVHCADHVGQGVLKWLAAWSARAVYLKKTNTSWQLVLESGLLGCTTNRGHVR